MKFLKWWWHEATIVEKAVILTIITVLFFTLLTWKDHPHCWPRVIGYTADGGAVYSYECPPKGNPEAP